VEIESKGMPELQQNRILLPRIVQLSPTSLERSHISDLYAVSHKCNYENA